jgi:hypothetical protein
MSGIGIKAKQATVAAACFLFFIDVNQVAALFWRRFSCNH